MDVKFTYKRMHATLHLLNWDKLYSHSVSSIPCYTPNLLALVLLLYSPGETKHLLKLHSPTNKNVSPAARNKNKKGNEKENNKEMKFIYSSARAQEAISRKTEGRRVGGWRKSGRKVGDDPDPKGPTLRDMHACIENLEAEA